MLYLQAERWSINGVLGVEALGSFYLVFLYVSLFQLVPNSVNSIFFPKGVKSYAEKRYDEFRYTYSSLPQYLQPVQRYIHHQSKYHPLI